MTHAEWIKTLNTEQLAEMFFDFAKTCSACGDESNSYEEKIRMCPFGKTVCREVDWLQWLKEKHHE